MQHYHIGDTNGVFGGFTHDVDINFKGDNPELNALNQMTDVYTYDREVIGMDVEQARVMTGFNANLLTTRTSSTIPNTDEKERRIWTLAWGWRRPFRP